MANNFLSLFKKRNGIYSAQEAYSIASYGGIKTMDELIKEEQEDIAKRIESRLETNSSTPFNSYNIVVEIDNDMRPYADKVFAPFKEKGYTICDINSKFPEIGNCSVFIISWANRPMAVTENPVEKALAC